MVLAKLMMAIALSIPTPNVPIHWNQVCPGLPQASCYIHGQGIYIDPELDEEAKPFALQHEYGHAYDDLMLNDAKRQSITKAMHRKWWPIERFADFFAGCRLGLPITIWDTPLAASMVYDRVTDPYEVARVCKLIATP